MSMTLDELMDWHARRAGWTMRCGQWRRDCPERKEYEYHPSHPFPPTLDGAASALPMGWEWRRKVAPHDVERWEAYRCMPDCYVELIGNGKEIEDRYTLAMLAWQQEAAR